MYLETKYSRYIAFSVSGGYKVVIGVQKDVGEGCSPVCTIQAYVVARTGKE